MMFDSKVRPSDVPLVEMIWQTRSEEGGGAFMSRADSRWEMVVTRQYGKTTLSLRGPETKASLAPIPEDAEFFGIVFKLGTFLTQLPTLKLVDGGIHLSETVHKSVWVTGQRWEIPNFENADTFVNRLIRDGSLVQDPLVTAALQGRYSPDLSLRTLQRRFLHATGLTHSTILQIQRAQRAFALLEQGASILDTIELAGYSDQPHLTRALKLYTGQTPAQIARADTLVGAGR